MLKIKRKHRIHPRSRISQSSKRRKVVLSDDVASKVSTVPTQQPTEHPISGRLVYQRSKIGKALDRLATILVGGSSCAAVTVINSSGYKILIAANELTKGSGSRTGHPNKHIELIKNVMGYLCRVAQGANIDHEDRKKLLVDIAFAFINGAATKGNMFIPEEMLINVVGDVSSERIINISDFHALYKEFAPIAAFVYMNMLTIYAKLCSLEKAIKTVGNDCEIMDMINAMKAANYEILLNAEKIGDTSGKCTHAEAQVLEELVRLFVLGKVSSDKAIYIGISKLSCDGCNSLSLSANESFSERKIPLKVEFHGTHGLQFYDKWQCPKIFDDGYNGIDRSSTVTSATTTTTATTTTSATCEQHDLHSLEFTIGKKTRTRCEHDRKPAKVRSRVKVSQFPSPSSSEAELDIRKAYLNFKQKVQSLINCLENLPFKDKNNDKNISLFYVLLKSSIIMPLLEDLENEDYIQALNRIVDIAAELQLSGIEVDVKAVLNIFDKNQLLNKGDVAKIEAQYIKKLQQSVENQTSPTKTQPNASIKSSAAFFPIT